MENSKQRKWGVVLSYISIIVNTLIQLIYMPLLIRMLGQSEYGLYSLVASVIGYLTVLDFGFGNAIIVYTIKYNVEGKYDEVKKLHGMFKIAFYLLGIIVVLLGILLYFNVDNLFSQTMTNAEISKMKIMMGILIFNLGMTFAFSIYSSIISAYEKFVFQKVISILSALLKPLIMIPLLIAGFKSITMCSIITIVNILVMFSNYYYTKYKLKIKIKYYGFDKNIFKTVLGYSFFIFLGTIVDKINWSVDQFVLGTVSGTIAVSLYSAASQINLLFIHISSAISGVLLPKMSKMIASNKSNKEITNEFIKVGRIQYLLIFLMASGMVIFGEEFFVLWVGKEYIEAYIIALFLILPACIPLIQNIGISILQAKNMNRFRSILYIVIAISNIMLSIPLAKLYGGVGAAIGTAISLIVGNIIIMNVYYYKAVKIDIPKFWKNILAMTIPMIIIAMPTYFINQLLIFNTWLTFIIKVGIFSLIYCLTVYLFAMNDYEKGIIENILVKLTSKLKKKENIKC